MSPEGQFVVSPDTRFWSYVRDERPWCGQAPPCAWYQFSVDRKGEHPSAHLSGYKDTVHADGFTGFNGLFGAGLATEQACMVHVRRKFVEVADMAASAQAPERNGGQGMEPGADLAQTALRLHFDCASTAPRLHLDFPEDGPHGSVMRRSDRGALCPKSGC